MTMETNISVVVVRTAIGIHSSKPYWHVEIAICSGILVCIL